MRLAEGLLLSLGPLGVHTLAGYILFFELFFISPRERVSCKGEGGHNPGRWGRGTLRGQRKKKNQIVNVQLCSRINFSGPPRSPSSADRQASLVTLNNTLHLASPSASSAIPEVASLSGMRTLSRQSGGKTSETPNLVQRGRHLQPARLCVRQSAGRSVSFSPRPGTSCSRPRTLYEL